MSEHLIELRRRIINCFLVIGALLLLCFCYSRQIFQILAAPLLAQLPSGQSMIATGVAAPVIIPLKLSLYVALILAMPVILHQAWGFVAPGLYKHEKSFAWVLLILSSFLFYIGILFSYFVVFPLVFNFFAMVVPAGVAFMPDINQYFDFCMKLFIAFGIAFEVPVATILILKTGLVRKATLAKARPYIIVGAFVLGMLLTPPDVISQILLAVPMWLLFEIGLYFGNEVQDETGAEFSN